MKIRTHDELVDKLNEDSAWRKKELSSIRLEVRSRNDQVVNRVAVVMSYAHWEGYVKFAVSAFIAYLNAQKYRYHEIIDNIITLKIMNELRDIVSNRNIAGLNTMLMRIRGDERIHFNVKAVKRVVGILTHEELKKLHSLIGIDEDVYALKAKFIDYQLVDQRNKIAHGMYYPIETQQADSTIGIVIGMLDTEKDKMIEHVANKRYILTATSPSLE